MPNKTYFLFLLNILFLNIFVQAQTINIPDPLFLQALIDVGVDLNEDGEIQKTEAEAVDSIYFYSVYLNNLNGINEFTNLKKLEIEFSGVQIVKLEGHPSLEEFAYRYNEKLNETFLTDSIIIKNCAELRSIAFYYVWGDFSEILEGCNIYISNLSMLDYLSIKETKFKDLFLYDLPNIEKIDGFDIEFSTPPINNDMTELEGWDYHFENLPKLYSLKFLQSNEINNLVIKDIPSLDTMHVSAFYFNHIDLDELPNLRYLNCYSRKILVPELTKLELPMDSPLQTLIIRNLPIYTLDISIYTDLQKIRVESAKLEGLNLTENINLEHIDISKNEITNLDFSGLEKLEYIKCVDNLTNQIHFEQNPKLKHLDVSFNLMENIDLSSLDGLEYIDVSSNKFKNIDLSNLYNLTSFAGCINEFTELDFPNKHKLLELAIYENPFISFDLSAYSALESLSIGNAGLKEINISALSELEHILIYNSDILVFDARNNSNLNEFTIFDNEYLKMMNLSNGLNFKYFYALENPNLRFICVDDFNYEKVIKEFDTEDVFISIDCDEYFDNATSFISLVQYDENGDCKVGSKTVAHQNIITWNDEYELSNYTNNLGMVSSVFPFDENTKMTLQLEQDELFAITPDTANIIALTDTIIQNFCISPAAGSFVTDGSIHLIPLNTARPGFDYTLKVQYANIGNLPSKGEISINYEGVLMTFQGSNEAWVDNNGILKLSIPEMNPLESYESLIHFTLNKPTDIPPLVGGETLNINSEFEFEGDVNLENNTFLLLELVVNSFDPNDKACLQGDYLLDEMVGKFLSYKIRFENTGTAEAINVFIDDQIDTSVFELETLRVIDYSHPLSTEVNGNLVTFYFNNIYLPFDDENNDGYVVYEIKTKDDLVVGDTLSNYADIFFDFNYGITTNVTNTTVATDMDGDGFNNYEDCDDTNADINPLAIEIIGNDIDENCDGELDVTQIDNHRFTNQIFKLYPNPTRDILNIIDETNSISNYLISVYNAQGNQVFNSIEIQYLNVQNYPAGIYFIKFTNKHTREFYTDKFIVL